ncbi:RNA 3'-terminal phosphate cyclase [Glaciecola sp. 1036]|uniref:RNA 3'-terminal phosphate cyclase n=1 Tax=Alteromonadaceae TaxID=72275 RepID=UPI003CFD658C
MKYITIDGSKGEGGGQVLRTALCLSIVTQQPLEIMNIRAGRRKPGLLRQHLTSLLAAKEISSATVEGAELGSTRIRFKPGNVKAGNYHFCIGTAGSTVLVCQTIFCVLALTKGISKVTFEGGTHNGMSPSLCFLEESFLPLMALMGVKTDVKQTSLGFYPAGGGKWEITIEPVGKFKPISLLDCKPNSDLNKSKYQLHSLVSKLPVSIAEREISKAKAILNWIDADEKITEADTPGPGNSFQLKVIHDTHASLFEVVGEIGVMAENIAKRCAGRVNKFLYSQATVEEHLADQLLLPMALAGQGSFTTTKPSLHTLTNIDIIKMFLDIEIKVSQITDLLWKVEIGPKQV